MLNVLYDYQHFSEQRYGGITRYFANLIRAVRSQHDIGYQIGALHTRNYYLQNEPLLLNNRIGDTLFKKHTKREIAWNKAYSKLLLTQNTYDLFHPTYYHPYFLKRLKKPCVVTVHDMIHEKFPKSFKSDDVVADHKREVIAHADKIIAVSQSTKNDLVEILNVPEDKIEVIHHGIAIDDFRVVKQPLSLNIPAKFFLYVGDRAQYKNFDAFASALAQVFTQYPDIYLLCAGGQPFTKIEVAHLTKVDIIHKCIRVIVTDGQLKELYQNAQMFVFPSLYEGFGLPLLEAFANLCPVVCSNTGCFYEVAGDAALYFDPYDVTNIAQALLLLLADKSLRDELVSAGRERVKLFPLKTTTDKTIAVYKQLV